MCNNHSKMVTGNNDVVMVNVAIMWSLVELNFTSIED